MKPIKFTSAICSVIFFIAGALSAQNKRINRTTEAEQYPDLLQTEKNQEQNINGVMEKLSHFGHLVELSRSDRVNYFRELKEPNKFIHTYRSVKFTPRNTYVRFVSNSEKFSLASFGNEKELLDELRDKIKLANGVGVQATNLQFPAMDGIEITHFDFIYEVEGTERKAVGSTRKTLTLYFKPAGTTPDNEPKFTLELAITKIVHNHLKNGVNDIELVVDPTPMNECKPADKPGSGCMDDIVIFHRYNQKPTDIALVGTMSNTPNDPHRLQFKQKFYFKTLDHFYRLMSMVNDYSKREGNDVNRNQLERLDRSLIY